MSYCPDNLGCLFDIDWKVKGERIGVHICEPYLVELNILSDSKDEIDIIFRISTKAIKRTNKKKIVSDPDLLELLVNTLNEGPDTLRITTHENDFLFTERKLH